LEHGSTGQKIRILNSYCSVTLPDLSRTLCETSQVPTVLQLQHLCEQSLKGSRGPVHAPCRAFSAQMSAMIRDSSALCSNCSLFTASLASEAAISLPVFNILFCNASIFARVLSRNGAENLMPSVPEFGSRISSFRGGFLLLVCGSNCCCFLGDMLTTFRSRSWVVTYGCRSLNVMFSAISPTLFAILAAMISKGDTPFAA
jgi:hypothetical protein